MYIKQVELSHFKSFGSTTIVPLLPGFTVISGPNGSGKSNILDALLFALGLSGSKGMRADRLPDLVNQQSVQKGRTAEANVSVTFALDPDQEWVVSRKLRVTSQGTYTSTYYVNGSPCTLGELHQQLSIMRIYPEGYNIVLQGDVTNIISMNAKERRMIIDELAGVGEFDRKIAAAKEKLADVKDQEDKFRIVEQELIATQEKLKTDRVKAEKYQQLRQELEAMQEIEVVLQQQLLSNQRSVKINAISSTQELIASYEKELQQKMEQMQDATEKLKELQTIVQSLGETEYLQLAAQIATQEAEQRSTERQIEALQQQYQQLLQEFMEDQHQLQDIIEKQKNLMQEKEKLTLELENARQDYQHQSNLVNYKRQELQGVRASAEIFLQEQTQLRQKLQDVQDQLSPLQSEQARIRESLKQSQLLLNTYNQELTKLATNDPKILQQQLQEYQTMLANTVQTTQEISQSISNTQTELKTCQTTVNRLVEEQRQKQRLLDRIEAQQQANQEIQGTKITRILMEAQLEGVCGLVAQLGTVDRKYQLALEIAASSRLGCVVVEDDTIASRAIQLLKERRAGRATFLPLNRMKYAPNLRSSDAIALGAIDYAFNLVVFEPKYTEVFAYVFGSTLVFDSLSSARRHLGRYRMVTIEGELLETSGAMTGGSAPQVSVHFGITTLAESEEVQQLRVRLSEIDQILSHLNQRMTMLETRLTRESSMLQQTRLNHQEAQLQSQRYQTELDRWQSQHRNLSILIEQKEGEISQQQQQLSQLLDNISIKEKEQQLLQDQLKELERSGQYEQLFQLQANLQQQEEQLMSLELNCRTLQQQVHDREQQLERLQEKQRELSQVQEQNRQRQTELINQQDYWQTQNANLCRHLQQLQQQQQVLEQKISQQKQERDRTDRQLQDLRRQCQELQWQIEKAHQSISELSVQQSQIEQQLAEIQLPEPPPIVAEGMTIEQAQLEQRKLQKRIQALEPVNMMAIVEYENITKRREELSRRLETLFQERTELLLRIENFTTLRQEAFMESFDRVNANFQSIFAELSDGDGHLQLENPQDPLSGGLNLVAHPKGKPVRHLASMSGGEKSLTALSFIFALQRYRPSPFYAFDEVDMFLDGANVEKLAQMVKKQAETAQFIVVSLRRPMIDASERTIGVTQARGMHTQVLGISLN
ncbi:MAG: chromosome segregation protein SMC [Cyanobacteria bacterium M5B4]|nr:MAG: chromosome segregation protein SMC [Cyanobacteria bacterium M5B4]